MKKLAYNTHAGWFQGFIHQGKWIAGGNSVDELLDLAQYQHDLIKIT